MCSRPTRPVRSSAPTSPAARRLPPPPDEGAPRFASALPFTPLPGCSLLHEHGVTAVEVELLASRREKCSLHTGLGIAWLEAGLLHREMHDEVEILVPALL